MRPFFLGLSAVLLSCLLIDRAVYAGGPSAADFPLRVHVFELKGDVRSSGRAVERAEGEGRADLFENSQPAAFDFKYSCNGRLTASPGFETYPARWKMRGQTLEILQPETDKPGAFHTCEAKVGLKKGTAYFRHNGKLEEEPAAKFKEWMDQHHFDPEHGKNKPQAAETH
jgi:hypothetical protein